MSEVVFFFDASGDGSAALSVDQANRGNGKGSIVVKKNTPVKLLLGAPLGMPDNIESVTMTFHDGTVPGWPFDGQDSPELTWTKGQPPLKTADVNGTWKFGAVLTSRHGRTFKVPDPELHVGDGPGDGSKG